MLTYDQMRDQEQLRLLDAAIEEFIIRHNSRSPTGDRKTIILFPGGMGSQLIRAMTPYEDGLPFLYHTSWIDCSIMLGAAVTLEMQGDLDSEHKFVIPDGCVEFDLMRLTPYVGFTRWCERNGFDWFIFGWDWRRRLEHSVDLFLNCFLPFFQQRVVAACAADPLANFALIGHSMGGMMIKLILNRGGIFVDKLRQAVTVATPFYGHAGQVHRYFKGDPDLDFVGKARLTRVISSMRGPYTLLFLDSDTYDRHGNALAMDPEYPLPCYPSVDAMNELILADPYNPQIDNGQVRYPQDYGFDSTELQHAKRVYQEVAAPLDDVVNKKFFNIRGVQASGGTVLNDTIGGQTWGWIDANFNPDTDPDPITDATVCPGDGVVPAWSARLITTPRNNVRSLRGNIEHMTMMNSRQTQDELMSILR